MNVKAQRPAKSVEPSSSPDHDQESRTPAQPVGPATLALPVIKPKYPAAELIRSALKGALARIQAADPEARRGEPEGVHRMRTSTRRLRSELRAVADLVDHEWSEHLELELKWLAAELGSVRDLDILCQGLRAAALPAPANGQASGSPCSSTQESRLGPLFGALRDRHAENSRNLGDELQGAAFPPIDGKPGGSDRVSGSPGRGLEAVPKGIASACCGRLEASQEGWPGDSTMTVPMLTFTTSASSPSEPATPPSSLPLHWAQPEKSTPSVSSA